MHQSLFAGLYNFSGPLSPEIKRRLRAVLADSNERPWNDTFAILLKPYMTLWRAVLDVDPSFPRRPTSPWWATGGPVAPHSRSAPPDARDPLRAEVAAVSVLAYLARSIASLTPNMIMTAPVVAAMTRVTRGWAIHERRRPTNSATIDSQSMPSTQ